MAGRWSGNGVGSPRVRFRGLDASEEVPVREFHGDGLGSFLELLLRRRGRLWRRAERLGRCGRVEEGWWCARPVPKVDGRGSSAVELAVRR